MKTEVETYRVKWPNSDPVLGQYEFSGYELIGKVRPGERVIHVDCGSNPFRGLISNFIGVDPVNDNADYRQDIATFARTNAHLKCNIAFCLDCVHQGTDDDIFNKIRAIIRTLRERDTRIYWRSLTEQSQVPEHLQQNFRPWTPDMHTYLADFFGFDILEMSWDGNATIYAEWVNRTLSPQHNT
jgi:hypothetical protein